MRRVAILLVTLLLFGGVAAAGDYETVLFTDDLQIDFRMKGWEFSRVEGETIVIDFKYNLTLANDAYNKSTITGFDLLLRNDTHVITRKELQTLTVHRGSWTAAQDRFRVTAKPEEINQMAFRANHTATLWDGEKVERQVQSRRRFELEVTNQTILGFTTNASEVYRDGRIFVDSDTSNVFQLSVEGTRLTNGDAGRFYGWVPVPDDLRPGNNSVEYVLTTARGQRFVETLSYVVVNRAPQFEATYRESIEEGQTLGVTVFGVDDTRVTNVSVRFRDRVQWNTSTSSPSFDLRTAELPNGTYTFHVTVVDGEGANTTGNRSFRITAPRPDRQDGEDGTGKGPDYSEMGVVEGIITFFKGFIGFLLPS